MYGSITKTKAQHAKRRQAASGNKTPSSSCHGLSELWQTEALSPGVRKLWILWWKTPRRKEGETEKRISKMKTPLDPRHRRRIDIIQQLFTISFRENQKNPKLTDIMPHIPAIDSKIQVAAPEWPIEKISRIDLAILRLAVYELTVVTSQPPKVIIDEAIELAKEFGNQNSPGFINGVLGTILKQISNPNPQ